MTTKKSKTLKEKIEDLTIEKFEDVIDDEVQSIIKSMDYKAVLEKARDNYFSKTKVEEAVQDWVNTQCEDQFDDWGDYIDEYAFKESFQGFIKEAVGKEFVSKAIQELVKTKKFNKFTTNLIDEYIHDDPDAYFGDAIDEALRKIKFIPVVAGEEDSLQVSPDLTGKPTRVKVTVEKK